MNRWTPISCEELEGLLSVQLDECSPEHAQQFARIRVPFRAASIIRGGVSESVFIVGQLGQVAIYYEDVEEGFNISEVAPDGSLATPGFEQWTIADAVQRLLALPLDSVRSDPIRTTLDSIPANVQLAYENCQILFAVQALWGAISFNMVAISLNCVGSEVHLHFYLETDSSADSEGIKDVVAELEALQLTSVPVHAHVNVVGEHISWNQIAGRPIYRRQMRDGVGAN